MPGLAAVVVLSLGVGIGVNTVVFAWIEAVVFRPIPGVQDAARVHLVEARTETGQYPGSSWLEYRDLRERVRSLGDLMSFRMVPLYLGESGRVERGNGMLVSDNYFSGLGLQPALGRFLRPQEVDQPGGAPVVVVSYQFWETRLGKDPGAVGRNIRVNGSEVTIVGVAPRGFQGTVLRLSFDLWMPATLAPVIFTGSRELEDRGVRGYSVMGVLRRPATRVQAQRDVDAAMRYLAETYPQTNKTLLGDVRAFWEAPRGPQRFLTASLAMLQTIMLLLLLAVCGNTANLLLARASGRQREMSVRLALGAGPWRVARLLLMENLLLALGGGLLGAAIAVWGTAALSAVPPLRVRGIPISLETSVDGLSLAFAVLLGIGCGLVFGMAPALQLALADPQQRLRAGSSTVPRSHLRNTLMAVEVGLALAVLVAGGLFLRSFMDTRDTNPGFKRDGVLLAAYDLTGRATGDSSARTFAATLLERLRAVPTIEAAAIATSVPLDIHGLPSRLFTVEGRARADGTLDEALVNTVTPGYFDLMGLPIRAGRDFVDLKDVAAPAQAIVNEEFVRRYLERLEPLGRRIDVRGRSYVIAGVVRNSLYNAFGEPPTPIIYFSFRDRPSAIGEVHLRARGGVEAAVAPELRRIVRDLDPELPIYDVRTLSDHIEANLIFRRIPARMFAVLGPLLLLLAAIGIYAVVAYTVSLRTAEIGVRLALGATAARLISQFVGESLAVVGVGAMAGWLVACVVALNVFAFDALDVGVFAGVPLILMFVASLACWLPARRITRVDPMIALRQD
jgi:predicted permease